MNNKVVIIAEAGVNHNGDIDKAIELIKIASIAGADFVKFQTFKTELNISQKAEKPEYQAKNTGFSESQYEMVKKLELSNEDFLILHDECKKLDIGFMSTGFDIPSVDFLASLKPEYYKIPSGEITNRPYLEYIGRIAKKIILSTGMADIHEIKAAVRILENVGLEKKQLTILHCNTEYPTPFSDVNLLAMLQIKNEFGVEVGYSDHTLGIEVPFAAVALGAKVIEKHFTLDRNLPGPDHSASLEPIELKAMVSGIRKIELAISGNGLKKASKSELKNISIVRKSLHFSSDLPYGHIVCSQDLIALRPGYGVSPMLIESFIGKKLNQNVTAYSMVDNSQFV